MRLKSLLLSALVAAMGCAHRAPPPASSVAAPIAAPAAPVAPPHPRIQFVPVPESEAAGVKNPHAFGSGSLCQRCHVPGEEKPSVDPIALCSQCHDPKHMQHPYGVAQATGAEGLPLLPGRIIACHTCHDPHDVKKNRAGLRLEYVALCLKCHTRHKP